MKTRELDRLLRVRSVSILKDGDALKVSGDRARITEDLLDILKNHKLAIQFFLPNGVAFPPVDGISSLPYRLPTNNDFESILASMNGAGRIQDICDLFPLQQGMLYHHLTTPGSDPYLLTEMIVFKDEQTLDDYIEAMRMVICRHDILRAAFLWEGLSSPVQVVLDSVELPVERLSAERSASDARSSLDDRAIEVMRHFNLAKAPLIKCLACCNSAIGEYFLKVIRHHILSDHLTAGLIADEIALILAGRSSDLPDSSSNRHLLDTVDDNAGVDHAAFFSGWIGTIETPTHPFGLIEAPTGQDMIDEIRTSLGQVLAQRVRFAAQHSSVGVASVMHLAWGIVASRCSDQDAVLFGTVLMGRAAVGKDARQTAGLAMNTLPMRVDIDERPVSVALREVHLRLGDLMFHERASLAEAQRLTGIKDHVTPFSSLLNFRRSVGMDAREEVADMRFSVGAKVHASSRTTYPLLFSIDELDDDFQFSVQVERSVSAARIVDYFRTVLVEICREVEAPTGKGVRWLPIQETDREIEIPVAQAPLNTEGTLLHELFEAQVSQSPSVLAVDDGHRQLTYQELHDRAEDLAARLCRFSGGEWIEGRIGISLRRSVDLVIGVLAVLKAGFAYVPLDPAYPNERLAYMVADSGVRAVIVDDTTDSRWSALNLDVARLHVDHLWPNPVERAPTPQPRAHERDLAYVIYTSGSTGQPKGVAVEHRSAVSLVHWALGRFDKSTLQRVLFATSLNFDLAVFECFVPLGAGTTIVLVDNLLDPSLPGKHVTLINTVPSVLAALLDAHGLPVGVEHLNLAGEPLHGGLVERVFKETGVRRIANLYGPSETTTYSSQLFMSREEGYRSGIGIPIDRTTFRIRDKHGRACPIGVPGELYIGGMGVARGYIGDPARTAAAFVAVHQGREYRTGDIAKWCADGSVELLGRQDAQVKIRGYRIELGEVEACIAGVAEITSCVVLAVGDPKELVAIITSPSERATWQPAAVKRLHVSLPSHMHPSEWISLDTLPLTLNGKIDRKALLDRVALKQQAGSLAGVTLSRTEQRMATLWREVLGIEVTHRDADFFELGGHSLRALVLSGKSRVEFGRTLPIAAVLAFPKLSDMSAVVDALLRDTPSEPRHAKATALSTREDLPAIYLVPPASGDATCYHDLVRALEGKARPIALEYSHSDDWTGHMDYSILSLAKLYLDAVIRSELPPPYHLVGWSLGGLIALQIAGEMEKRALACTVTLVDSVLPSVTSSPEWLVRLHRDSVNLSGSQRAAYIRSAAEDPSVLSHHQALLRDPTMPLDLEHPHTRGLVMRSLCTRLAALDFRSVGVRHMHYIAATSSSRPDEKVAALRALATATFHASIVRTDHFSILRFPVATQLAELILRIFWKTKATEEKLGSSMERSG